MDELESNVKVYGGGGGGRRRCLEKSLSKDQSEHTRREKSVYRNGC